jgi:plasmid stabilization system protein ParE
VKVVLRAAARRELREGAEWYDARVPGLGLEFARAVKAKIELIAQSPHLFEEAEHGTRKAVVGRFPYTVFYRVFPARFVLVAVFHSSRRQFVWRGGGH